MLGADNILITIKTAANMQGVEEAKTGIGGLNLVTAALTAGIGLAVVAGKSFIEIAEKQQKAHNQLAQAVKTGGGNLAVTDAYLQSFISTNRAYLSSQSDVQDSYGALLRSGVPVTEAQKDLSRATDLAALKGISLTEATDLLVAAEHGRTRGLIDLGITTSKYTDAEGNVIKGGHNMAAVMKEVDAAVQGGRQTLTESEQTWNLLNNDWQDLAAKYGPGLITEMDRVVKDIEKNMPTWEHWLTVVGDVLTQLLAIPAANLAAAGGAGQGDLGVPGAGGDPGAKPGTTYIGRAVPAGKYSGAVRWDTWQQRYVLDTNDYTGPALPADAMVEPLTGHVINKHTGVNYMAAGGWASPGSTIVTGEHGPELLQMGAQGGYVTPHGAGGNNVHVHLEGIYAGDGPSLDILANKIALRLGYATGR